MKAHACVRAVATGGRTRLAELRSEAPLVLRETPDALYLVGGAGGPLGGDDLSLSVDVGASASLRMRSAGATLVQPGPHGDASHLRVSMRVGEAGHLEWAPEPVISVRGSDHVVETIVDLEGSARLVLHDEVVLGRTGEEPGRLRSSCRVRREGDTVLAHDLDLGGDNGWAGAAVVGSARIVTSILLIEPAHAAVTPASVATGDGRAARFPLASGAVLYLSLTATRAGARCLLESLSFVRSDVSFTVR